jgi:hypothetical protein
MRLFIRECADDTVLLCDETGQVLSVYCRIEDAIDACAGAEVRNAAPRPQEPVAADRMIALVA